ncbi:uncharacterized protein LOC135132634 isoform X2 [Zophobas morio]|uniref:uncharacterized protein LOC135132634 isoform X2 n=1 Tax=Zophobas morio TaxID=2755281 RepID=UPI003082BA43
MTVVLPDELDNFLERKNWKFSKVVLQGDLNPEEVYDALRPVRQLQFLWRLKNGNGGFTIVTYADREFIIFNNVMYECEGTILATSGTCSHSMRKVDFSVKSDFCYARTGSTVNNKYYCIANGPTSVYVYNDKIKCESTDNSPSFLVTKEEYSELCGNRAEYPVLYKYFTNDVGEHSADVHCSDGDRPYVCTFIRDENGNVVYSGVPNIHANFYIFVTAVFTFFKI